MYIFLDCDGVINQLQPNYYIDEKCVAVLGEIVKHMNGKIVLTSTWRYGYLHALEKCTSQIQNLLKVFEKYGITCVGRTKKLSDRQEEIDTYIKDYGINEYLILDDDKSLFKDVKCLYLVNAKTGLVKRDIKEIEKRFRYGN